MLSTTQYVESHHVQTMIRKSTNTAQRLNAVHPNMLMVDLQERFTSGPVQGNKR